MVSTTEIACILGIPARLGARVLFLPRYICEGFSALKDWSHNEYARARFGPSYRWRVWLLFDVKQVEMYEKLINEGSDEEILCMRDSQLEQFRLVSLVGALLAAVALQAFSLPALSETHFSARACFLLATALSVLATFFTCIQQREFSTARSPAALRAWISNGVRYTNHRGEYVYQSSMTVRHLLDGPYEFLAISVANFLAGMTSYLASAWVRNISLGNVEGNGRRLEDLAVITYFAIGLIAAGSAFNLWVLCKARERKINGEVLEGLQWQPDKQDEADRERMSRRIPKRRIMSEQGIDAL